MSPEDLADRYPYLYHLTSPDALESIRKYGLLTTVQLLELFEAPSEVRGRLTFHRRRQSESLTHPTHGRVVITDNKPLSEVALANCLEDDLQPRDWLAMLNNRVFFWPSRRMAIDLAQAKENRSRVRLVLVLDTLRLVRRHFERVELTAINTGSTIMMPAKRGLSTFVPIGKHTYSEFRNLRRKNGTLREVVVRDGVRDVRDFLVEVLKPSDL